MNNIEMLNTDIDELKAEILGEMLGEAYVYRDSIVTPKVKTEEV